MLLIYFYRGQDSLCETFEKRALSDSAVIKKLEEFTRLRVAVDSRTNTARGQVTLLNHASFEEMLGTPGLAMIDLAHKAAPYYGRVVSTFPFLNGRAYTAREVLVMLGLPPGTLTQRTLIYAVRTHPDGPASTDGELEEYLCSEAESHSTYQARIRNQGHHFWERRFHRINSRLPGGLMASEVCAESWPGERLLEAAIECVRCWRLSSGHWSAVRQRHRVYGYDMKRGSNGVWYATGVFGRRR
jgi:hypothetical protein